MAFDSLSERLNKAMRNVAGKGRLTDANMEDMLKEVRLALLEADVNYRIVKDFLNEIREKARKSIARKKRIRAILHMQSDTK